VVFRALKALDTDGTQSPPPLKVLSVVLPTPSPWSPTKRLASSVHCCNLGVRAERCRYLGRWGRNSRERSESCVGEGSSFCRLVACSPPAKAGSWRWGHTMHTYTHEVVNTSPPFPPPHLRACSARTGQGGGTR